MYLNIYVMYMMERIVYVAAATRTASFLHIACVMITITAPKDHITTNTASSLYMLHHSVS